MMDMKVRNHAASIALVYIKKVFPDDYRLLCKLATENYTQGYPACSPRSILDTFLAQKEEMTKVDVL